jgi:uncharacterized membrane protein YeaQ/YmgE (transglycosylase-associated protein family)
VVGQILWAIIAGLVIGSLARLVVRGRQDIPLWLTILFGIAGALVGKWLASAIGVRHTRGIDRGSPPIPAPSRTLDGPCPSAAYRPR